MCMCVLLEEASKKHQGQWTDTDTRFSMAHTVYFLAREMEGARTGGYFPQNTTPVVQGQATRAHFLIPFSITSP